MLDPGFDQLPAQLSIQHVLGEAHTLASAGLVPEILVAP